MRSIALVSAAAALAAAVATPAQASGYAASSPGGVVTASDGGTAGSCAYTRTTPMEWGDAINLEGAATSLPDGSVSIRCTVVTRAGTLVTDGYGVLVATVSDYAVLPDGPTTICIEIVGQHTIDVRDEATACRRF